MHYSVLGETRGIVSLRGGNGAFFGVVYYVIADVSQGTVIPDNMFIKSGLPGEIWSYFPGATGNRRFETPHDGRKVFGLCRSLIRIGLLQFGLIVCI